MLYYEVTEFYRQKMTFDLFDSDKGINFLLNVQLRDIPYVLPSKGTN